MPISTLSDKSDISKEQEVAGCLQASPGEIAAGTAGLRGLRP